MTRYDDYIARQERLYGNRFDPSDLAEQFIPYFNSGERIRVATGDHVRTGTVSVTTGWKPALMLKYRSDSHGSSDLLGSEDRITHVKRGHIYCAVQAVS